jgi:hypothetical protein
LNRTVGREVLKIPYAKSQDNGIAISRYVHKVCNRQNFASSHREGAFSLDFTSKKTQENYADTTSDPYIRGAGK